MKITKFEMELEERDLDVITKELENRNFKEKSEKQPKIDYRFTTENENSDMIRELPEAIKDQLKHAKSVFVCDAEEVSEEYKKTKEELNKKEKEIYPTRFNTGLMKITMSTPEKVDIYQISDIDKDIAGYDRICVFDIMERKADVTVINYGSDALYLIINRNGIDHPEEQWTQSEIYMNPGSIWKFFDVHEIRIRSETQGNKYQITEDEVISGSMISQIV